MGFHDGHALWCRPGSFRKPGDARKPRPAADEAAPHAVHRIDPATSMLLCSDGGGIACRIVRRFWLKPLILPVLVENIRASVMSAGVLDATPSWQIPTANGAGIPGSCHPDG